MSNENTPDMPIGEKQPDGSVKITLEKAIEMRFVDLCQTYNFIGEQLKQFSELIRPILTGSVKPSGVMVLIQPNSSPTADPALQKQIADAMAKMNKNTEDKRAGKIGA